MATTQEQQERLAKWLWMNTPETNSSGMAWGTSWLRPAQDKYRKRAAAILGSDVIRELQAEARKGGLADGWDEGANAVLQARDYLRPGPNPHREESHEQKP